MPWKKMDIALTARRFALAGVSLCLFSAGMTVLAAEGVDFKKTTVRCLDGHRIELAAPAHGVTVLIFYSIECPISNSYSPTLSSLVASFPSESVKWLGVCVDPDLSDSEVEAHARDFGLKFPLMRDRRGSLARKLGATITPETFVIDADGKVRYHGRIDDQFVARRSATPTHRPASLKTRSRPC